MTEELVNGWTVRRTASNRHWMVIWQDRLGTIQLFNSLQDARNYALADGETKESES